MQHLILMNTYYCQKINSLYFVGGGFGLNDQFENIHAKVQYGAGLEYMASDKFGIKYMWNIT
jgi:curli production assembly/transport component CsgG